MKRKDGRDFLSMRKIKVEFDVLKNFHGSCRLTQGGTSVIASVLGPSETSPIFQHPTQCSLKVGFSSPYFSQNQNFHHAVFIRKCFEKIILLELHPMKRLFLTVDVLSDDGCSICVAVNALTLALMRAGVNMKGCVLSIGVGISQNKVVVLDPLKVEVGGFKSTYFFLDASKEHPGLIGMLDNNNISQGEEEEESSGCFESEEAMMVCLASARKSIKSIHEFVRLSMRD